MHNIRTDVMTEDMWKETNQAIERIDLSSTDKIFFLYSSAHRSIKNDKPSSSSAFMCSVFDVDLN